MRKYLWMISVGLFILTLIVLDTVSGKFNAEIETAILLSGVGLSILLALFSVRGKMKIIILGLYGLLIVGFIVASVLFAVSHM